MYRKVLCAVLLVAGMSTAQVSPPAVQSDAQALSLANASLAALGGGNAVMDVTLNGSVSWVAGSDQATGTATLKARGTTQSRADLAITTPRSEIRNDPSRDSYSLAADGTWKTIGLNNCWTDASWFFPALSSLANTSNPNFLFTYVGRENWSGFMVQHIKVARINAGKNADASQLIQRLSTIDFYLDTSTSLPLAASFNAHADDDANVDIAVTVAFFDYRSVTGVFIPFHVQQYVQGGLEADFFISSAVLNSGLPDATFAAQ